MSIVTAKPIKKEKLKIKPNRASLDLAQEEVRTRKSKS
jgi:hypothetical protein